MAELEVAARAWKNIAESVGINDHPSVWVGHYRNDVLIGSVHATTPKKEAEHVLVLGTPFAICQYITDTFVFVDRPNTIMATRLHQNWLTHWDLPYMIGDHFEIAFGTATKRPHPNPLILHALNCLWDKRKQGRDYDFAEAYAYSIEVGTQIESD